MEKSELSFSNNVPTTRQMEIATLLGMKVVESHDRYLGLLTLVRKSKTQIFSFIRDRIWKKLKCWKEKTLFRARREVLVTAVMQAILTYILGCFLLPKFLCDQIESMISRFY